MNRRLHRRWALLQAVIGLVSMILVSTWLVQSCRFMIAIRADDARLVNGLLTRNSWVMYARDLAFDPPLIQASKANATSVVLVLLKNGAKPNKVTFMGSSALHEAALFGYTNVVTALLEGGADTELKAYRRRVTPLHVAAHWGQSSTAKLLIKAGAHIDATEWGGETPLMRAALENRTSMTKYLLSCGADVLLKDRKGRTAIDIALEEENQSVVKILSQALEEQKRREDGRGEEGKT